MKAYIIKIELAGFQSLDLAQGDYACGCDVQPSA